MQHYVCTGDCGGEAEKSKVCDSDSCSKEGQSLTQCGCDDGLHAEVLSTTNASTDVLDVDSMDDEDDL